MASTTIKAEEKKYLLWTNPTAGSLSAQTISLPVSEYSQIEIWVSPQGQGWEVPYRLDASVTAERIICAPRGEYLGKRAVQLSANAIRFGDGGYFSSYGNYSNIPTQNGTCVPNRIYGIK